MADSELKVGDIVVLKSDQNSHFPIKMTINAIELGSITCVWAVSGEHNFRERTFNAEALVKY